MLAGLLVALNGVAWCHARAFTRFADSGERTPAVEESYAGSKDGLLEIAADFQRRGLAVWLLDFRGGGGSTGRETSVGWHEARDVAAAVHHIRQQHRLVPLLLYGHSMGAAAILGAVAREQVRPDALILERPFNSLVDTVGNRVRMMGLPAFPVAQLLTFWGGVQQGFNGFAHRPVDDAKAVRCPTLLWLGRQDRRVTVEQGHAIGDNLGPLATTFVLPDCGHESTLQCAPGAWSDGLGMLLAAMTDNRGKAAH